MSDLFDVATTRPGAARILGTTQQVVFPVLGPAIPIPTASKSEYRARPSLTARPIGSPKLLVAGAGPWPPPVPG